MCSPTHLLYTHPCMHHWCRGAAAPWRGRPDGRWLAPRERHGRHVGERQLHLERAAAECRVPRGATGSVMVTR